jgi:enoyl-CoA hydratase/carnithine racemase
MAQSANGPVVAPDVSRDDGYLDEHIVVLTLNYARRRNALSAAMLRALGDRMRELRGTAVRAVILRGAGTVFSSGHDLNEILNGTDGEVEAVFDRCHEAMLAIREAPQVVVAEVQGLATAAGCQLVATADLAVASSEARFATPGVDIGYFCVSPGVPLSRNVGMKAAAAMLFTGDPIDAEEARRIGLINQVAPTEALSDAALALARRVASHSGRTLALGKRHFYQQLELPEFEALRYAGRVMVEQRHTADAREGIGAFLQKRPPRWAP